MTDLFSNTAFARNISNEIIQSAFGKDDNIYLQHSQKNVEIAHIGGAGNNYYAPIRFSVTNI